MYLPKGELSRAVLIGTSDFQHPDLPQLPAVNQNLFALCRALTDHRTGILPDDNCEIVQNPDSPDSLMQRLRRSADQAEHFLLVYYAGHGLRHARRDDLYLSVRQTNPAGLDGTAVEYDWVREVIADSPAKARLLILDCCYSGLALDRMSGAGVDSRELAVGGTSVMASSPRNKQSHSPVGERHTAFTGELLSLLAEGSPLPDTPLTVQNTFKSIKAGLARRDFPLPTLRADDTSGEVLLRRQPEPPKPVRTPHPIRPVAKPEVLRQGVPPARLRPIVAAEPVKAVERPAPLPSEKPVFPGPAAQTVQVAPVVPPAPLQPVTLESNEPDPRQVLSVQTKRTARTLGRGLIWFWLTTGVSMFAGGLVGSVLAPADEPADDTSILIIGLVLVAVTGTFLLVRARRGAPTRTGVISMLPTFNRVPAFVLIAFAALGAAIALVGIFGPPTSAAKATSTYSPLALDVSMVTLMVEWSLLAVQAVILRKSAHQTPAGDQGQVQGRQ